MLGIRIASNPNGMPMLTAIKLAHTVVWALLVGCIVTIPAATLARRFDWAAGLSAVVLAECVVLALNGMRCPLTDLAERYTTERAANFDIYLPEWLARNNKIVFGSLFTAGELVFLASWLAR